MNSRRLIQSQVTENDVVRDILHDAALRGIKLFRVRERIKAFGGRPSDPGFPDLTGWIPGRLFGWTWAKDTRMPPVPLYVEAKRPVGGKKRLAQIAFITEARQAGCVAIFAKSVDEFEQGLREAGVRI